MNNYLKLPKSIQWLLAILLLNSLLWMYAYIGIFIWENPIYFPLLLSFSPLFYFFTTPFFTLIGKYQYFSEVMFGYKSKNEIEIHLGTSFDYLFTVFPNWLKGQSIRNQIKRGFIEGNLTIINKIENSEIDKHTNISTTSHLINQKTFQIFNVLPVNMNFIQKLEYYLYTLDLLWMYLFSCGFKRIHRIFRVNKVQIRADYHCNNKTIFQNALHEIEATNKTKFTISQYQNV